MRKQSGLFICMLVIICLLVVEACGSGEGKSADTLTQRQHDSIVAASKLPGAKAVQGALRTSDAAAARASALDSINR